MATQAVRICICRTPVEIQKATATAKSDGFTDVVKATEKAPSPINVGTYIDINNKGNIEELTVVDYTDAAGTGALTILICRLEL